MTPGLRELLERRLARLRQGHASRLHFEESEALKQLNPSRGSTVGAASEELLRRTGVALSDYCGQVKAEVTSFVERTLPQLAEGDRDEVLQVAAQQFDKDLYLKRFTMFEEAIQRQLGRTGHQIRASALGLDLVRARHQVGTSNQISRFVATLKDDLDLAVVVASTRPDEGSTTLEVHRQLLSDLFQAAAPPPKGIDRRAFRKRHHLKLDEIDEMARSDWIREVEGFYSPTLLALAELRESLNIRQLFDDCDQVLAALHSRYLENHTDMILSKDLAKRAGLSSDRLARALAYLQEAVPVLAGSRGTRDSPQQEVLPAEKVLSLKRIDDVLAELRRYRQHRTAPAASFPDPADGASVSVIEEVTESKRWLQHLPDGIRAIVTETFAAQHVGLWALALMGVRAAIDMTCNDLLGTDLGRFDLKLDGLRSSNVITDGQWKTLQAVVHLGHASAHRGHIPSAEDATDVIDILERLLKAQYVDQHTTQRLVRATPPRQH